MNRKRHGTDYFFRRCTKIVSGSVLFYTIWLLMPQVVFCAGNVLVLEAGRDKFLLGSYIEYLEDRSDKLTIEDITSPGFTGEFIRNKTDFFDSRRQKTQYWLSFTIQEPLGPGPDKNWLLYFGWPKDFNHGQLFFFNGPERRWQAVDVGRVTAHGIDPLPSSPVILGSSADFQSPVTYYLKIYGPAPPLPIQLITQRSYQNQVVWQLSLSGIYYGVILAMVFYNLVLYYSLREGIRIYYIFYLVAMGFLFFARDGGLYYCFEMNPAYSRRLLQLMVFVAFFFSIGFARGFLVTKKRAPYWDKVFIAIMIMEVIFTITNPFVDLVWHEKYTNIQLVLIPPLFIYISGVCYLRGYKPARFFLLAFSFLALGTFINGLAFFGILPYSIATMYGSQVGSGIEVILLQIALAERITLLKQERDQIRHSLQLASEVQHSLLPRDAPNVAGTDIAGWSRYCDETGGDHFDFFHGGRFKPGKLELVVSDVSGHGISSALLMATARAFLRQRASLPGDAAEIITDVNYQISLDVEESGQFLTMFYLGIDLDQRTAEWVSAGHDPALVFDAKTGEFQELAGRGPALGLLEDFKYPAFSQTISPGQIILIATDGVWEAHNQYGEMFGKERLREIMGSWSNESAQEIVKAVIQAVEDFCFPRAVEDDITLVVVKVEK